MKKLKDVGFILFLIAFSPLIVATFKWWGIDYFKNSITS